MIRFFLRLFYVEVRCKDCGKVHFDRKDLRSTHGSCNACGSDKTTITRAKKGTEGVLYI